MMDMAMNTGFKFNGDLFLPLSSNISVIFIPVGSWLLIYLTSQIIVTKIATITK